MKKKHIFILIIAALAMMTFWNIGSKNSRNTKADVVDTKYTSLTIERNDLPSIQNGYIGAVDVVVKPVSQNPYGGISHVTLYLNTTGDANIVGILDPMTETSGYIPAFLNQKTISGSSAMVSYDIYPYLGYPNYARFRVQVQRSQQSTQCTLSVNTTSTDIYYPKDSQANVIGKYDYATIQRANCQGIDTISTGPTASVSTAITPSPTVVLSPTANPTMVISQVPSPVYVASCQELAQPQNLSPAGSIFVTAEGQKLSWDSVAGAKFYGIEIWEGSQVPSGGVKYTKIFTTSTVETSYTYTKFSQDKQYLWKVSAVDSCNNAWTPGEAYITVLGSAPTVPLPFPTATPTPVIPPVTIKMRLRFQGIYTQPSRSPPTPQVFLVWVKNSDKDNPIYKWVTAKYDQTGSWFIEDTWNLVPGDGYKVWIKGEKHLQRQICDGKPSDQESGFYKCGDGNGQIVIKPGENYLDFSNVIMFAGDIPFKGESDGVLDAFDLSYIATHFEDSAETIADLNFDGITDSQDYGIAINAIRIQKYDETYPYKIHPFFRNVPLHPQFP